MKTVRWVALALPLFPATLFAKTATDQQIVDLAKSSFSSAVEDFDLPGLVVGVTTNGQHTFFSTGLASRKAKTAVSPDTLFEVGSISKIFNVSLAALAEERGLLDLNAPVARRIPRLKNTPFGRLRLMDLALHSTGGLPLQVPKKIKDISDLIDWLARWKPTQPGARSYSNISIGLLGYITANAFSKSYTNAVEQDLLPMMGLRSTWINIPDEAMNRYAFGYRTKTNQPTRIRLGVLGAETAGVKTTARDLLRLLDLHLGRAKASPQLQAVLSRTREGRSKNVHYIQAMIWEQYPWPLELETLVKGNSLDFILNPQPAQPVVPPQPYPTNILLNKTGSTRGFGAYIMMLPSEHIGIEQ